MRITSCPTRFASYLYLITVVSCCQRREIEKDREIFPAKKLFYLPPPQRLCAGEQVEVVMFSSCSWSVNHQSTINACNYESMYAFDPYNSVIIRYGSIMCLITTSCSQASCS